MSREKYSTNTLTQLQLKIIYWGPGEAGKTTNFNMLKRIFRNYQISDGFSIATSNERTLWNDSIFFKFILTPVGLELIINVATTTGQERFLATREYVVQNADGIIFVADSSPDKMEENLRSFQELLALTRQTHNPILIQLNKQDLANALSVREFRELMALPVAEKDQYGFNFVYPCVANDPKHAEELKVIFLDLIQKILLTKYTETYQKSTPNR